MSSTSRGLVQGALSRQVHERMERSETGTRDDGYHGHGVGRMEHYQQRNGSEQLQEKARQTPQMKQEPPQSPMIIHLPPVDQSTTYYGHSRRMTTHTVNQPNTSLYRNSNSADQRFQRPPMSPYYTPHAVHRTSAYQMYQLPAWQNSSISGQNTRSSSTGSMSPVSFCLTQIGLKVSTCCIGF
jgi:hypothetical protein